MTERINAICGQVLRRGVGAKCCTPPKSWVPVPVRPSQEGKDTEMRLVRGQTNGCCARLTCRWASLFTISGGGWQPTSQQAAPNRWLIPVIGIGYAVLVWDTRLYVRISIHIGGSAIGQP